MSDIAAAIMAALDARTATEDLPRRPKTSDQNHPWRTERRREPRQPDPEKWAPPAYRDHTGEDVIRNIEKEK